MVHRACNRISLRQVAIAAAFGALLAPLAGATAADAATKKPRPPVVTGVSPMRAEIGDELTIRGRHFVKGRNKNTVVFRRDGSRAVFAKAPIGTSKLLKVKIPVRLDDYLTLRAGAKVATRFRLRVLSARFGKAFTPNRLSPMISPDAPPPPPTPPDTLERGDCDNDGQLNSQDADDDNDKVSDAVESIYGLDKCKADSDGDGVEDRWEIDCDRDGALNREDSDDDADLLPDATEAAIMTAPCSADTDGDRVEDGYEYRSARDLNDGEEQHPDTFLPYPGKRPYPNPLDGGDANVDHDGDSLSMIQEYALWKYSYGTAGTATRTLNPLSYSAGEQYSVHTRDASANRRPALAASGYERHQSFLAWAQANGRRVIRIAPVISWSAGGVLAVRWHDTANTVMVDFRDANLSGACTPAPSCTPGAPSGVEAAYYDNGDGWLSDDERDEDADGLSNFAETRGPLKGVEWWTARFGDEGAYPVVYKGTSVVDADTDGDGVRDGADDQDNDDLPNVLESDRVMAQGPVDHDNDGATPAVYVEDYQGKDGPMGFVPGTVPGIKLLDDTTLPDRQAGMARAWVNPFNPCLPNPMSRTCLQHPEFGAEPAPFNESARLLQFSIRN